VRHGFGARNSPGVREVRGSGTKSRQFEHVARGRRGHRVHASGDCGCPVGRRACVSPGPWRCADGQARAGGSRKSLIAFDRRTFEPQFPASRAVLRPQVVVDLGVEVSRVGNRFVAWCAEAMRDGADAQLLAPLVVACSVAQRELLVDVTAKLGVTVDEARGGFGQTRRVMQLRRTNLRPIARALSGRARPGPPESRFRELRAARVAYSGLATGVAFACFFGALNPPIIFNTNALLFILVTTEIMRCSCLIIQYRCSA
jgi:hypothetical protein